MTLDHITQQDVPHQIPVTAAWTTNHIIDRLKQRLASVVDSFDNRRYYLQALNYLKAGVFKPVPAFVVNLSDLTPKLIDELYQLDNYDRRFVLKQAVGRIFEDVNFELYHNSISKVLDVRLE
jgi:hypothetical protein